MTEMDKLIFALRNCNVHDIEPGICLNCPMVNYEPSAGEPSCKVKLMQLASKELDKFYNPEGFSCRNETIEHLKPYHPSFDKKGVLLYRIALNIAEVADQLAEQNKYVIATPKEY